MYIAVNVVGFTCLTKGGVAMAILQFAHRAILGLMLLGAISLVSGSPSQASDDAAAQALFRIKSDGRVVPGAKVTMEYQVTVQVEPPITYSDVTEFVEGSHEVFPALEQKIVGMKRREQKQVTLKPEEAFGERDEQKKMVVAKTELPPGAKIGDILRNEAGTFATVEAESETAAVLDYNHPLAGKSLVVKVTILDVGKQLREPTPKNSGAPCARRDCLAEEAGI
jgi:FKBP-type peptidyl-prolyl cis-trans isomerase 2